MWHFERMDMGSKADVYYKPFIMVFRGYGIHDTRVY